MVFLNNGQCCASDLIICCTGWNDNMDIFDIPTSETLGLPRGPPARSQSSIDINHAEARVSKLFPILKNPPSMFQRRPRHKRQWDLYRRVIPLSHTGSNDNSLVFLGQIVVISTMLVSGIQSLWAVAYLRGMLRLPPEKDMRTEVADWNAWTSKRYLRSGDRVPYAIYDSIPVRSVSVS